MPSAIAQAQGATGAALGTVGTDILPSAGQLWNMGSSNLTSFSDYLNNLTSANPSMVTQAAGPQIANITSGATNAGEQISTLPRGGEQDYLKALNAMNESSQISQLLNQIITGAHTAQGQLGQYGTSEALGAEANAAQLEIGAGSNFLSQAQLNQQAGAATASTIADILKVMAMAAAGA